MERQCVPSSIPNRAEAHVNSNLHESIVEEASPSVPVSLSSADKAATSPDQASASGLASAMTETAPVTDTPTTAPEAACSPHSAAANTAIRPSSAADLADSATHQLRGHLRCLHDQLMQQAGADYDIATATTLSYSQFLSYITRLNEICRRYADADGRVLVFAVKKGSDSSFLWKATVRIACVKYDPATRRTESYRLLTIRQFLQVFRRISYECSDVGSPTSPRVRQASPASVAFEGAPSDQIEGHGSSSVSSTGCSGSGTEGTAAELEECIICLERKPDVILPCAHAYCLPCIQQWWEYCAEGLTAPWFCSPLLTSHALEGERTCPVCREAVADADEAWVISEAPDEAQ
ncbi:Zinc finger C3HC4 RING-type, partial [Trinorchestia longiramus]